MGQPYPNYPGDTIDGDDVSISPMKAHESLLAVLDGTQSTRRLVTDASRNLKVNVVTGVVTVTPSGTQDVRLVNEADTFARMLQGYVKDTEELRLQSPTTFINGVSYVGVAIDGSATSASVWSILKVTYDGNGRRSRVQYRTGLTWDLKF